MRVLIVGHGRMGRFHAATVRNAGDTAITLDPHATADHLSWHTIPDNLDAAIIATPIPRLYDNALEAVRRGLRVLIEKPGAASTDEAFELYAADPDIAVGYVERVNPVVRGLRAYTPEPGHVTFTRKGPAPTHPVVSIDIDVTSHDIDLHRHYWPNAPAAFYACRQPIRQRTITCDGYTADLITRRLTKPDGTQLQYPMDDLLTEQWRQFRDGSPTATISDAIAVHHTLTCRARVEPIAA